MVRASTRAHPARRIPPPEVNGLVRVTVGSALEEEEDERPVLASEAASRVEDAVIDPRSGLPLEYLIAAPWFAGDVEQPAPGTDCALQWPTERGLCILPVEFVHEEVPDVGLRFWRVKVTGPVRRTERRRYVRAPWALPAELIVRDDLEALPPERRHEAEQLGLRKKISELPAVYSATCINVSEGGLLCVSPGPVMPAALPVIARFTIEQTCFETSASIVWSLQREGTGPGTGRPMLIESAVSFDDPGKLGEVLRPLVFQAQLRARRVGLL